MIQKKNTEKEKEKNSSHIHHSKKLFLFGSLFMIFISALFLAFNNYIGHEELQQSEKTEIIELNQQRMSSLLFEIDNIPGGIGKDILFLTKLSPVSEALSSPQDIPDSLFVNLNAFMNENKIYNEICFLNLTGYSVLTLHQEGNGIGKCNSFLEEDFLDRLYSLKKDKIYMTRLVRNKDNHPVIVYSSPVYNNSEKLGYLVAQISADYFLEDIRNFNREGENVFLIDNSGNYLAHKDLSLEFSKDHDFCKDYFNEGCFDLLDDLQIKYIETEDSLIFFKRIYPTASSFSIYRSYKYEEDYFWVLVTIENRDYFEERINAVNQRFLFSTIPTLFILLGTIIILFIILTKKNNYLQKMLDKM
jgi:hypothetical protein